MESSPTQPWWRGQGHQRLPGGARGAPPRGSSSRRQERATGPRITATTGDRTPDWPEEEPVKEEIQESEGAVEKMLAEATRELEEVVVDESPDSEIHRTMCDDESPTPEEDSETQPDQEEEETVSPPEVGAAIMIIPQLMEKFNLDLSTVTQAFLSNDGELKAASSFLASGQS
ncbi:telomeric repeat-binding factor 2-interacting protein 1-like [Trachypithecus francoisi]|uniref:telomeric repeat-binding factor 2-interacting protein 1-like n=1 Tax=Trachypithecus francoisi TaxID=54180 RepID=UPI00141AD3A9|nr:telomeric repeat-binding factor 2-interacting protein 1-like [Trachypithecus francoisi]